jgi:hypothetical protein
VFYDCADIDRMDLQQCNSNSTNSSGNNDNEGPAWIGEYVVLCRRFGLRVELSTSNSL